MGKEKKNQGCSWKEVSPDRKSVERWYIYMLVPVLLGFFSTSPLWKATEKNLLILQFYFLLVLAQALNTDDTVYFS